MNRWSTEDSGHGTIFHDTVMVEHVIIYSSKAYNIQQLALM